MKRGLCILGAAAAQSVRKRLGNQIYGVGEVPDHLLGAAAGALIPRPLRAPDFFTNYSMKILLLISGGK